MSFYLGIDMWICSCLVMGCNFPCQKVTKKITRSNKESEKAYKSRQLEERYWPYVENLKEYPHLHVSNSKSSFSTNLFGRFPNTKQKMFSIESWRQTALGKTTLHSIG